MFRNKFKEPYVEPPKVELVMPPAPAPAIEVHTPPAVVMQEIEYRPCWANGRRALFHRWVNDARPTTPKGMAIDENTRYFQFRSTKALVEFEDGTVDKVWPNDVQFADGGHFRDFVWLPMEEPLTMERQEEHTC